MYIIGTYVHVIRPEIQKMVSNKTSKVHMLCCAILGRHNNLLDLISVHVPSRYAAL
jgi:hypothetical protein